MFTANVLRVMIASPGDVKDEREIVTKEIYRWNDAHAFPRKLLLQPIKWETHSTPRLGAAPQDVLNEQILDDADMLIGIFGTRVGTATEKYISGTVEEIKRHVAAGKTAKVYFSDVPVPPSEVDPGQYTALQEFKEECRRGGLYWIYDSVEKFKELVQQHLAIELNSPRYLWISVPSLQIAPAARDSFSDEERTALLAASESDGDIIQSRDLGGESVQIGEEIFTDGTVRNSAVWRETIKGLEAQGLIEESAFGSGIYRLTGSGFRAADEVRNEIEQRKQLEVKLAISGVAAGQTLAIKSNKKLQVRQLEFLTTSGVCAADEELNKPEEQESEVSIDHGKVVKLFNTPRGDRSLNDHSGPALLRLTYTRNSVTNSLDLPVMMRPVFINQGNGSTQYINLEGQKRFYLNG